MSADEARLVRAAAQFRHDPLGFVQFAYPWGISGTPLANSIGPDIWQASLMNDVRNVLRRPIDQRKARFAVASGKGIGKSAQVAWLIEWAITTFPDTMIVLTAGTEPQLRTKTMPELARWHRICLFREWFKFTATSLARVGDEESKTWRMDAIPWNENNPEAFAGLHNQGRRIVVLFDEASQIADPIWNTTDGIFSDKNTEVLFFSFGNPTRGDGKFRQTQKSNQWNFRSIDARTVAITDKQELADYVRENGGENSDLVRVNIRGMFPSVSDMQFISNELVMEARKRSVATVLDEPLILGVDVARFGKDKSILSFRKGRDARTIPWVEIANADTVAVANAVAHAYETYGVDAVNVDEGGAGGGVADNLRRMNVPFLPVQFGSKPDRMQLDANAEKYANKRAEMWGLMRQALPTLAIPDDAELDGHLTSVLYGYMNDRDILLEKKEHMRNRGMDSPDKADALALTFARPVLQRRGAGGLHHNPGSREMAAIEYDHLTV